jgi:hypothetical protein
MGVSLSSRSRWSWSYVLPYTLFAVTTLYLFDKHRVHAESSRSHHDNTQLRSTPSDHDGSIASTSSSSSSPPAKFGPRLTIFSGGSGFNTTAILLKTVTNQVTYIMPVSDNGGSTAEISRVLGGPALGDIRSRLMALASHHSLQEHAVTQLLKYRLPNHPCSYSTSAVL